MPKFLRSGNARLYLYLGILVVMGVIWRVGESINQQLSTLTIRDVPRIGKGIAAINEKNLYPAWVKQAVAQQVPSTDEVSIDPLFRREEEHRPDQKTLEPDYGQKFKQSAVVDGMADDGVFLSGRFYQVGAKLEVFAMTDSHGKSIVPTLDSVNTDHAIFVVGQQKISLAYKKK